MFEGRAPPSMLGVAKNSIAMTEIPKTNGASVKVIGKVCGTPLRGLMTLA